MANTINKPALAEILSTQEVFANTPKYKIIEFIEDFFGVITTNVIEGTEVSIPGFGKFEKYERQNGEFKPKFTAFKDFKDAVKGA